MAAGVAKYVEAKVAAAANVGEPVLIESESVELGLAKAEITVENGGFIGYTVPQKITGESDVVLSFRPRKPMRDQYVDVYQGDTLVASKKYVKLLPAEMEKIKIPAEKLVSKETVKVVTRDE